jgi:hypothetical protein
MKLFHTGSIGRGATVAALGAMLAFGSATPSAAFVGPGSSLASAGHATAPLTDVAFRGRGFGGRGFHRGGGRRFGGGFGRRGYGGRGFRGRGYGYGGGGAAIGAGIAGLAAGALIGGAIASSQAAPAGDPVAYCESRYRSYNPATGTYTGYDGLAHACP